jgi:hypothetical protein
VVHEVTGDASTLFSEPTTASSCAHLVLSFSGSSLPLPR